MIRALAFGLCLSTLGLCTPAQALATPAAPPSQDMAASTISLSADGEIKLAPDIARLELGVTTHGATAAEALAKNRERMAAAVAALKASGVAAKDIQTSRVSLNPDYVYEQNQPPKITGYSAGNAVTAVIRDLTKAGPVIDKAADAGANTINGLSFDLADRRAAEDQARLLATKALQQKLGLYAQALGLRVSRLVTFSEEADMSEGVLQPRPAYRMVAMAAAPPPTTIEPGDMTVRITVSAVYELKP
jgi:uncharacterized protein YggE